MLKKLIVILGPTAVGKSELASKLTKKFNGELVSADSRQIYQGMDIGTGKDSQTHYLIDAVRPDQEFNVAIYKKMTIKAIENIQKQGKLPFLVGGTGLYIWAIVDNINFPSIQAQKKLRETLEKETVKELFKIYRKLDPQGAKFIEKENKRRLVRAIEVCKTTGQSFWKQRNKGKPLFDTLQIGINLSKERLKRRIVKRTERMIKIGLEKEVKQLIKKYGWLPSLQTIGYQEWQDYFNEKIDKKRVQELISTHTMQYAKRQMTWFKRDKRIHWVKNYKQAETLIKKFC